MKKKLLIVGAGGFGRMVAEQAMLQYDCAFVDDGQPVGTGVCGTPVVGEIANLPELRKSYGLLVVGIGNNNFRVQVYEKAAAMGYTSRISLHPVPTLAPTPNLVMGVSFCRMPVFRMVQSWAMACC